MNQPDTALSMALLQQYCKQCKLAGISKAYQRIHQEAQEKQWNLHDFFLALLEEEILHRKNSRYQKLIKLAALPQIKTLEQFEFSKAPFLSRADILDLHQLEFLTTATNILFLGEQGTGKTHLLLSLAHQACLQGYTTWFTTAAHLGNQLAEMQDNRSLERFLLKLKKVQVLCIDELGYVKLSSSITQLLFQVIADRYESGSILLTSNLEFTEWTRIFQDERMTAAILDRLVHKSRIFVFKGPSYRLNDSMERKHKTIHRKESSERKTIQD